MSRPSRSVAAFTISPIKAFTSMAVAMFRPPLSLQSLLVGEGLSDGQLVAVLEQRHELLGQRAGLVLVPHSRELIDDRGQDVGRGRLQAILRLGRRSSTRGKSKIVEDERLRGRSCERLHAQGAKLSNQFVIGLLPVAEGRTFGAR